MTPGLTEADPAGGRVGENNRSALDARAAGASGEGGSGSGDPPAWRVVTSAARRRRVAARKASRSAQPAVRRIRGFSVRMFLGGLIGVSRIVPMRWAERL